MWWQIILGLSGGIIFTYFFMLFTISFRFKRLPTHFPKTSFSKSLPSLSIIVPFRNEKNTLANCIKSLTRAAKGIEQFQIILVDDGSEDGSEKTGKNISVDNDSVEYFLSDGEGKKYALSFGIEKARGDWIFTSDADCVYPDAAIYELFTQVLERELDVGTIPVVSRQSNSLLSAYDALESHGLQAVTAVALDTDLFYSASGAALLYPKQLFQKLQPYQENDHIPSGDDQFFLYAYRKIYNKKIFFLKNPKCIVQTDAANSWNELIQQRLRWSGKSIGLKDVKLKTLLSLIMATDITIVFLLLLSFTSNSILFGGLLFWFSKMLAESYLLYTASKYWKKDKSLYYMPLVTLIRPLFQIILLIYYLTGRRNYWKGRLIFNK